MSASPRTATFLFTDLENSTPLWDNHPELMPALAARHDALLREAITAHRGHVIKTTGDGFHAIFEAASDGVAAALAGQQAMRAEEWPVETGQLQVRMGLHTGESRERDGDFYGAEVNRAARVMGIGHGGQVLISEITASLTRSTLPTGVTFTDLGRHRLKGLSAPEQIFQLCHPALQAEFPPLKSLSVYRHNLPVQLTTFVGRSREMAAVHRALAGTRLLSLLGPGGTGKTRLMLECAEDVIGDFADGVWLVELAPLTQLDRVDERVAAVLNVQEQPGRPIRESLVDYLQRKDLLLLLDNAEHLVQESADLVQHLLSRCPKLKILITSREALLIPGELTLQVPSLSLPAGERSADVAAIRASEAVQLFITRAQAYRPDFELNADNAATIAGIVHRLDGIPLALELVTARLRMLSVDQIAERLGDRFRLLTGGRRTALPHQQTLQALIDWSWNLLDEKEQTLLRRLSVFSGGWSLEAAQAVTADGLLDEFDVLDLLEQLVNKSLVTVKFPDSGAARYGMLESIHHYARHRLAEAGEDAALRERHAAHFVAFAEEAGPHLVWTLTDSWLPRVVAELDNLRAALAWTLEQRPAWALRIAANLFYTEVHSLPPREARAWLEAVLEKARSAPGTAERDNRDVNFLRALLGLGITTGTQGRYAESAVHLAEAKQLARTLDEPRYAALVLAGEGAINPYELSSAWQQEAEAAVETCRQNRFYFELFNLLLVYALALDMHGSRAQATPLFREAVALFQAGRVRLEAVVFVSVQFRLAHLLEDTAEEERYIASALDEYRAVNHRRGTVIGQSAMAHLLRRQGRVAEAEVFYRQSVLGWQELGHRGAVAHQLECLAYVAIGQGEYRRAAQLLGAAGAARTRLNAPSQDPQEIAELTQAMEELGEALGEESRDEAIAAGSLISLDDAVQIALTG